MITILSWIGRLLSSGEVRSLAVLSGVSSTKRIETVSTWLHDPSRAIVLGIDGQLLLIVAVLAMIGSASRFTVPGTSRASATFFVALALTAEVAAVD